MSDIVSYEPQKNTAYNNILRFYTDADIVLSAEEDTILNRWLYCDSLIRQRKFRSEQIINDLVDRFGVSKFTATTDIKNTYALFGQVRVISKQYIIAHSIERIQLKIEQFENDKSLVHLVPKMYDTLAKFTAQLEEELARKKVPASMIFLNVVQGQQSETMPFDKAKEIFQKRKEESQKTYDDFEDVK